MAGICRKSVISFAWKLCNVGFMPVPAVQAEIRGSILHQNSQNQWRFYSEGVLLVCCPAGTYVKMHATEEYLPNIL